MNTTFTGSFIQRSLTINWIEIKLIHLNIDLYSWVTVILHGEGKDLYAKKIQISRKTDALCYQDLKDLGVEDLKVWKKNDGYTNE